MSDELQPTAMQSWLLAPLHLRRMRKHVECGVRVQAFPSRFSRFLDRVQAQRAWLDASMALGGARWRRQRKRLKCMRDRALMKEWLAKAILRSGGATPLFDVASDAFSRPVVKGEFGGPGLILHADHLLQRAGRGALNCMHA